MDFEREIKSQETQDRKSESISMPPWNQKAEDVQEASLLLKFRQP
jgi:hypothetical protein